MYVYIHVCRWIRAARDRLPVECCLAVVRYKDEMGRVDQVDKNVALSRLRLKRCIRRYHRAFWLWYMAFILNNILVLFDLLFDTDALKKSYVSIGYKHWFQNQYGDVLIVRGIRLAEQEKLHVNAKTIIKFMRRTAVLRLYWTARYVKLQRRVDARIGRQQRLLVTLRDRANRRRPAVNVGGRPVKRRRGGGRRPAATSVVCPFTPPGPRPVGRPVSYTPVVSSTSPLAAHAKLFARYLRRRKKFVLPPFSKLPAVLQQRLQTFSFANKVPSFVPKRRGRKKKTSKTADGLQVGGVTHRYVRTKDLQSRRGRRVALRSHCTHCYANAPTPLTGGRKTKTSLGVRIPSTTYACDVCRILLCKSCFWNGYDHRSRGKVCDFVTLL